MKLELLQSFCLAPSIFLIALDLIQIQLLGFMHADGQSLACHLLFKLILVSFPGIVFCGIVLSRVGKRRDYCLKAIMAIALLITYA